MGRLRLASCTSKAGQLATAWLLYVIVSVVFVGPPILFPEIRKEWNLESIQTLPEVMLLGKIITVLPAGEVIHRLGSKFCMVIALFTLAIASALYCRADSLAQLAILHGLYGTANSFGGIGPCIIHINSWFPTEQHGRAVAIFLTGFAAAGAIWPPTIAHITVHSSWQNAAAFISALFWFLGLPVATLFYRRPPSSLKSSAGDTIAPDNNAAQLYQGMSWTCLPEIWLVAASGAMTLAVVQVIIQLLDLTLTEDSSIDLEFCGLLSSLIFLSSLAGKIASGFAIDGPRPLSFALLAISLFSFGPALLISWTSTFSFTASRSQLQIFAVVYGLGYGSFFPVLQSCGPKLFGKLEGFARIQSALKLAEFCGAFVGVAGASILRDKTGSFVTSFAMLPFVGLIAGILYLRADYLWRFRASRAGEPMLLRHITHTSTSFEETPVSSSSRSSIQL